MTEPVLTDAQRRYREELLAEMSGWASRHLMSLGDGRSERAAVLARMRDQVEQLNARSLAERVLWFVTWQGAESSEGIADVTWWVEEGEEGSGVYASVVATITLTRSGEQVYVSATLAVP